MFKFIKKKKDKTERSPSIVHKFDDTNQEKCYNYFCVELALQDISNKAKIDVIIDTKDKEELCPEYQLHHCKYHNKKWVPHIYCNETKSIIIINHSRHKWIKHLNKHHTYYYENILSPRAFDMLNKYCNNEALQRYLIKITQKTKLWDFNLNDVITEMEIYQRKINPPTLHLKGIKNGYKPKNIQVNIGINTGKLSENDTDNESKQELNLNNNGSYNNSYSISKRKKRKHRRRSATIATESPLVGQFEYTTDHKVYNKRRNRRKSIGTPSESIQDGSFHRNGSFNVAYGLAMSTANSNDQMQYFPSIKTIPEFIDQKKQDDLNKKIIPKRAFAPLPNETINKFALLYQTNKEVKKIQKHEHKHEHKHQHKHQHKHKRRKKHKHHQTMPNKNMNNNPQKKNKRKHKSMHNQMHNKMHMNHNNNYNNTMYQNNIGNTYNHSNNNNNFYFNGYGSDNAYSKMGPNNTTHNYRMNNLKPNMNVNPLSCDTWYSGVYNRVIVDLQGDIVKVKEGFVRNWVSIYGSRVISHGQYTWKIKILRINSWAKFNPIFGIIENNPEYLHECKTSDIYEKTYAYGWSGGARCCCNGNRLKLPWGQSFCKNTGDIITMRLDLVNNTLSIAVNNDEMDVIYYNIKKCSYRVVVSALYDNNVFQFL